MDTETTLRVRLPAEFMRELDRTVAARVIRSGRRMTRSDLAREALRRFLDDEREAWERTPGTFSGGGC